MTALARGVLSDGDYFDIDSPVLTIGRAPSAADATQEADVVTASIYRINLEAAADARVGEIGEGRWAEK